MSSSSPAAASTTIQCSACSLPFPSKNQLFKHLRSSACGLASELTPDESTFIKVAIIYGYYNDAFPPISSIGDLAASLILRTIPKINQQPPSTPTPTSSRSFGISSRTSPLLNQDTIIAGALSEVLSVKLSPFVVASIDSSSISQQQLVSKLNILLQTELAATKPKAALTIQIFGVQTVDKTFNAEAHCTSRSAEVLVPYEFFADSTSPLGPLDRADFATGVSTGEYGERRTMVYRENPTPDGVGEEEPTAKLLDFCVALKKVAQQVARPNLEKAIELERGGANVEPKKKKAKNETAGGSGNEPKTGEPKTGKVKRTRLHNFSDVALQNDVVANRMIYRFFQKGNFLLQAEHADQQADPHPFLSLCVNSDMFMKGQVTRMVGLLVTFLRSNSTLDPEKLMEALLDEEFPSLLLLPQIPSSHLSVFFSSPNYAAAEGKMGKILRPRSSKNSNSSWTSDSMISTMRDFKVECYTKSAKRWLNNDITKINENWTIQVFSPFIPKATKFLDTYDKYILHGRKMNFNECALQATLNSSAVSKLVPPPFEKVLAILREIEVSGRWPKTSEGRAEVIYDCENDSSAAIKSGSFSIGKMPTGVSQPKANALFPDLLVALNELEMQLFPRRAQSSTIAVNRNANFLPHTDSGAGLGQSLSAIVALGEFSGGNLVVEGESFDIRYTGKEFNGWTERHWTEPFVGERFSLVWFTPKGIEQN